MPRVIFESRSFNLKMIYISNDISKKLNTQNMTNPTIVSPVKMEYGWYFTISGLKMMVKSGLEKIFLKFLHAEAIFFYLIHFTV